MIRITTDGATFLNACGHAGYAPYGSDIVCAGISALYQTLETALEKNHEPEDRELLIRSFLAGMEQIAKQYPNNIEIELV